ncbi:MAG: hypothetical protein GY952_14040 [Rhodobacteraceae bacterium]|nr:hypothetical protein [Paracoccaceae bacterium]
MQIDAETVEQIHRLAALVGCRFVLHENVKVTHKPICVAQVTQKEANQS